LVNAGSIQDTDRRVPRPASSRKLAIFGLVTEHVIEGAVFEHHDNDVVDLLQVGSMDPLALIRRQARHPNQPCPPPPWRSTVGRALAAMVARPLADLNITNESAAELTPAG